jgi:hypothetical protein
MKKIANQIYYSVEYNSSDYSTVWQMVRKSISQTVNDYIIKELYRKVNITFYSGNFNILNSILIDYVKTSKIS